MAITHVWTGKNVGSSPQLAAHLAGDLIIMVVVRAGSSNPPGLASGWTNILTNNTGYTDHGLRIAYRVAEVDAPGGASAGSWSNGTMFFATIYRGADAADPIGATAVNVGSGTTVTNPGLTLEGDRPSMIHVGSMRRGSWNAPGLGYGATSLAQQDLTSSGWQSGYQVGRSSNEVTSWTSRNASISPADPWKTFAVEILSGSIDLSTSGGLSLGLDIPAGSPVKAAPVVSAGQDAWQPVPIPNGTFETSVSGWSATFFGETLSEISRDTTVKRTGTASMRIEARRDLVGSDGVFDTGTTYSNVTAAGIKGGRYRLSAWVYADDSCDEFGFGAWFDTSIPWVTTTTKGEWVNLVTEGVLDPERDYISLAFDVKGTNAVGWVDDITIEYLAVGNPLDLTVAGEVDKAEGEIKYVTSDVTLETLLVSGYTGATMFANIGLALDLGAAGAMEKAADIDGVTSLDMPPAGVPSKHVNRAGAVALGMNVSGAVSRGEDNLGGLLTRLVAYAPNGESLGPLPGAQSWNVTIPYGADDGAFDCEYPNAAPRAEILAGPVEVALEVHDGSRFVEPWDSRWLILNQDTDEADPAASTKATGVSMGFHLSKTYVADGPTDGWTTGERRFTSATAGRIMTTLCAEAKARGALAGVDVSTFSATTDSAGRPWSLVMSLGFEVGVPMSSVVEALVQQGMMEVRWDKRKLLLFDAETSSIDRTTQAKPVILTQGRDVKSAPVSAVMGDVATVALVRGDEGLNVEVTNGAATSPWGRWETTLDQGGVIDTDALETAGAVTLSRVAVGREQHTHALSFVGVQAFPLLGYTPGDWLWSAPGMSSANRERYRLQQITLSYGNDGVSGSVILNDRLVEQDVKTKKRLDGIQGGASNAGPRPRQVSGDNTTPNAPTNLSGYSSIYLEEGAHRAEIVLTWVDPSKNTDGSNLDDLNMVQVWARPNVPGVTWRLLTAVGSGSQSLRHGPLPTNQTYQFRLSAIDYSGHTSDFSNTITVNLGSDTTAPPRPAAPETSTRNGVVEVSHDGKTNTGGDMPADFSHFEVYARNTSAVSASATYRVGTIAKGASSVTLTNWAYNQSIYAAVVAVDISGNRSQLSPVSSAAYNDRVDSGDIANDAVGPGQVNVPALDSAGNLNVNQLTGKTITGITINGGLFRSTNTSQRVEIGDTGPADSVDEIRMFNGGRVCSIRNPSDSAGTLRLNAANTIWNLYREADGHPVMQSSGRGMLKWLTSASGLQVRTLGDAGYAPMWASEFTVSSKVEFKHGIKDAPVDAVGAVRAAHARKWKWKWDDEGEATEHVGLLAEELPAEIRSGDGYSVTGAVALLWDALREAHERIDRLENP